MVNIFINGLVCYVEPNSCIGVYSSSAFSKMSQSECLQCCCILTCCWIFFWPLYCSMNKDMDNKIIAHYQVAMNMPQFQQAVSQIVPPLVFARVHGVNIPL